MHLSLPLFALLLCSDVTMANGSENASGKQGTAVQQHNEAADFSVRGYYANTITRTTCGTVHIASLNVAAIGGFDEALLVTLEGAPAGMRINATASETLRPTAPDEYRSIFVDLDSDFVPDTVTFHIVLTSARSGITHRHPVTAIFTAPVAVHCTPLHQIYTTDMPVALNSSTIGVWEGPGVDENTFDPEIAGPGSHLLRFRSADPAACGATTYCRIEVADLLGGASVGIGTRWSGR